MYPCNRSCRTRGTRAALWAVCGAALVALTGGCAPKIERPQFTLEQSEWKFLDLDGSRLVTDHFDIRTTVTDKPMLEELPTFLESCYTEYGRLVGAETDTSRRLDVYLFYTRPEWWIFTEHFVPAEAPVYEYIVNGGYTDQATATGVFWWIGRDRTLATAAHEGLHQYVARHLPHPIPAWLNEGLATQMETFELHDGVPVFQPRRNLFRRNQLKDALIDKSHGLFGLAEFLNMHAGQAMASPEKPTATYYAQAWSLVLFLRMGPVRAYCDGYREMMSIVGTDAMRMVVQAYRVAEPDAAEMTPSEILFRRYITEDYDTFMAEYVAFARDLVRTGRAPGDFPW
jgi:hypothetical protein